MWQLCKLHGDLWQRIEAIFKGEVHNARGNFKVPTGIVSFLHIAKIPQEQLVAWLDQVIQGNLSLANFTRYCQNYKARERLREAVAHYI